MLSDLLRTVSAPRRRLRTRARMRTPLQLRQILEQVGLALEDASASEGLIRCLRSSP